jgi:hypothetical protein
MAMSDQPPVQKSYIPAVDPAFIEAEFPNPPSPTNGVAGALKWLNRIVATSLVLFMGVFAWSAVQSRLPSKDKRPKCGIDWLMWAAGSDETFNSAMAKKLEAGSHEFDDMLKKSRESNPDMMKFVSGPIDFNKAPLIDLSKMYNTQPLSSSKKPKRR